MRHLRISFTLQLRFFFVFCFSFSPLFLLPLLIIETKVLGRTQTLRRHSSVVYGTWKSGPFPSSCKKQAKERWFKFCYLESIPFFPLISVVQRWWSCSKIFGVHFIWEAQDHVLWSRMFKGLDTSGWGDSLLEYCASKSEVLYMIGCVTCHVNLL